MLARIWLRRERGSDCKITEADYEALASRHNEIKASINEEDILGAFDRGEEVSSEHYHSRPVWKILIAFQEMGVYTMTCVGYDEEFIRFLVRNVHRWDPPTRKSKQDTAPKRVKAKTKQGTGSKRRPLVVDSESEDPDNGGVDEPWAAKEEDEDEDENVKLLPLSATGQGHERRSSRQRVKRVRTS